MFIKQVILENFQSYEKGIFNLDPCLNIIVGISNVGKSSLSRALGFILFGQPWDKSWVRFGAKYCRVIIQTDTGIEVIREKGDKVNRYILKLSNQPEQLFESFGTAVPEQVQQALKIHEVQIDTTDKLNLNLAGQMDALFLLSQTGSYRAKVLGKLSGATYLDHAIRELNKDKRQITAEKNLKDLEIVELQAQMDKLAVIESYTSVIAELESKLALLAAAEQRLERIRSLFERVKVLKAAWLREFKKSELLGPLDLTSIAQLTQRVDKIKALSSLSNKIVNLRLSLEKQNKLQQLLQPVDISAIPVLVERVSTLKKTKDLAAKVSKNQRELVSKADELQQVEQQHREAAKQYGEMLQAVGVCPICNRSTEEISI